MNGRARGPDDRHESRQGGGRARCLPLAAACVFSFAALAGAGAADAGEREGAAVELVSPQALAQSVLLHRGRARGTGPMRRLRTELVDLRAELAGLDADPSPERVGRALGRRQAVAALLAEAAARVPARGGETGAPAREASPRRRAPVPALTDLDTELSSLLAEVDAVLADPVGQHARLEEVRRRLDDALQPPGPRGGFRTRLVHRRDLKPRPEFGP